MLPDPNKKQLTPEDLEAWTAYLHDHRGGEDHMQLQAGNSPVDERAQEILDYADADEPGCIFDCGE